MYIFCKKFWKTLITHSGNNDDNTIIVFMNYIAFLLKLFFFYNIIFIDGWLNVRYGILLFQKCNLALCFLN
jgi:hypothetical protein